MEARFVHVNIVAEDWRKLAEFYQKVFGCAVVPPERDISGQWLEDVTNVERARIQGAHLRLPGHGDSGPTLEIFQYNRAGTRDETAANRPGFGHIAFAVEDVEAAKNAVVSAGGKAFGKLVSVDYPGYGRLTVVYVTDPEGNLIELQKWTH
ncbi:VOC family protein [Candidatus Poribacteria bacterium]|nr:VOC family protein [Candidatus Poribacteria bacterium]